MWALDCSVRSIGNIPRDNDQGFPGLQPISMYDITSLTLVSFQRPGRRIHLIRNKDVRLCQNTIANVHAQSCEPNLPTRTNNMQDVTTLDRNHQADAYRGVY